MERRATFHGLVSGDRFCGSRARSLDHQIGRTRCDSQCVAQPACLFENRSGVVCWALRRLGAQARRPAKGDDLREPYGYLRESEFGCGAFHEGRMPREA
jgi:hypothetical protein